MFRLALNQGIPSEIYVVPHKMIKEKFANFLNLS